MHKYPNNVRLLKNFRGFLIKINYDLLSIKEAMNKANHELYEYDVFHYYVMALEDRRFLKHCGIDFKAILREIYKLLIGKKYGGASTIDMQMVRTITGFKEKTLRRKVYEIFLAFIINFKYNKKDILNCYMSEAFFGSHLYGLNTAIEQIYGKNYSLYNLSLNEKAELAAMLQKPKPLQPSSQWKERIKKRALYAQEVYELGKVSI